MDKDAIEQEQPPNIFTLTADRKPKAWHDSRQNVWRSVQQQDQQVGKAEIDDEVVGGTVKASVFLYNADDDCVTKHRDDHNNQEGGHLKPALDFGESMEVTGMTLQRGWKRCSI